MTSHPQPEPPYDLPSARPCPACAAAVPLAAARCPACDTALARPHRVPVVHLGASDGAAEPADAVLTLMLRGPHGPCAPAILAPAPKGDGLGVWVLSEETEGYCAYDYAGGIS